MNKPTLFIAVDGPLLVQGEKQNPLLNAEIVPYAKSFLTWAIHNFTPQLITDRSHREVFHLIDKLNLPADKLPVRTFEDSKIEVVGPHQKENFYWVDGELIPHEVSWLAQHGHANRFFQVNPEHGISPELKERLERHIGTHKNA